MSAERDSSFIHTVHIKVPTTDMGVEHRQFIANDGSNRGLFKDGFGSDPTNRVHMYEYYNDKRYDADIIDKAMREVENEMLKGGVKQEDIYKTRSNNCQHYINRVLTCAQKIAHTANKPLFID